MARNIGYKNDLKQRNTTKQRNKTETRTGIALFNNAIISLSVCYLVNFFLLHFNGIVTLVVFPFDTYKGSFQ